MFSRMFGKRAAALATSLAVVVGLIVSPAFAATAAEGDAPVVTELPASQAVETPPAVPPAEDPPAEGPPAEDPPAKKSTVAEPVETPPAQQDEKSDEKPGDDGSTEGDSDEGSSDEGTGDEGTGDDQPATPQNVMRGSAMGVQSMGTQSFGVQSTGITPASLPSEFLLGQELDVQFGGVDADRWTMNFDFLSNANLSDSGHLTGYFSRPGTHTLTVNAQEQVFGPIYRTIESKKYTFTVVPAVLTSSLPNATVGVAYSQVLDAADYPEPDWPSTTTFSLKSGSLPPGLSLNANGTISGTVTSIPANPTTYTFDVGVRVWVLLAGAHDSAPKTLSITVGYPAPTWGTITLPDATVGVTYPNTSITAGGNGWPVGSYVATGLPDGLSLSTAGVISGTPVYSNAYDPIETVTVTFTADNGSTSSTTADIVVYSPPVITTTSPLPDAVVGTPYSTTIGTLGPDVTYTLLKGPAGMTINPATGELSGWTPTDENNVRVRVKVSNAAGDAVQGFTIKPFAVPTISTTTLVNGIVGQSYADQIVFDGRNAKLTKTSGKLPNGVSLKRGLASNGAGVLSGTPTKAGVFTFTVEVTNSAGTVSETYEIRVHDVPVIHVTNLARALVGQAYTDSVQFSGLDAVATLHKGALPAGMTLNPDGTFSGAPTETGAFAFTVKVSNPAGSVKHRYRIVSFDVPAFTTTTLDQGIVGIGYSQQLTADGHNVRFVVPKTSSLPAGLTLEKNGLLHGTPNAAGDFTFDVRAKNFAGKTLQSFTLTITQPATTLSTNNIIRGNTLTVNGTGYLPGDTLEFWLNSKPVKLGTGVATGGTFTKTVRIPANTPAGAHHLVVKSAQSGTTSTPLRVSLPAAPPSSAPGFIPQSQGVPEVTPAGDESSTGELGDDAGNESPQDEADDELPTLDQPTAEGENGTAAAGFNWTGIIAAAGALLLAALLLLFILWRRRRAAES